MYDILTEQLVLFMRGRVNLDKNKSQDTKQKLIDAAIEVFSEKGFDGARVDEIAARANINKAMLYYYFNSKEKLFEELIKQYKEDVKSLKNSLLKDLDLDNDKDIDKLFAGMYDFMYEKKDVLRIIMIESLKSTSQDVTIFNSLLPSVDLKLSNLKDKGVEVEDTTSVMINSFFYMLLPAAGFIILGDRWMDFYGFDKKGAKKKFLESYKEIRKNFIHKKVNKEK